MSSIVLVVSTIDITCDLKMDNVMDNLMVPTITKYKIDMIERYIYFKVK